VLDLKATSAVKRGRRVALFVMLLCAMKCAWGERSNATDDDRIVTWEEHVAGSRESPPDSATRQGPGSPSDLRGANTERNPAELRSIECGEAIEAALQQPALPGTPALDRARLTLLTNVKAQPVIFMRAPTSDATDDPTVLSYRRWWRRSPHPGGVLNQLINKTPAQPALVRAVALREGYLYADDLARAQALVRLLRPEHLFSDPEIWLQRGEEIHTARRVGKQYRYASGPQRDELVTLILFDRLGNGKVPDPLHLDVRALRYRLGFERFQVLHQSRARLLAEVRYGPHAVVSLFERQGAHVELLCEQVASSQREALDAWRAERRMLNSAFIAVQQAVALQVRDGLPFDEPRHEIGQEDGKLRGQWRRAYDQGLMTYRYHDDVYPVFGRNGTPHVPEVCVDFLLDTLERAAGTWWASEGEPRERRIGKLDFEVFDRERLRRVPEFVQFAFAQDSWFDVLAIPSRDQIPIGKARFLEYLAAKSSEFVPGDIVLIGGYVPWDPRPYVHYHSFFILESDPISGMPLLIASNPGQPRQLTWTWEGQRTPWRTLRFRIRPRAQWLSSIVQRVGDAPPPMALSAPSAP
jgi:hypothetical protein